MENLKDQIVLLLEEGFSKKHVHEILSISITKINCILDPEYRKVLALYNTKSRLKNIDRARKREALFRSTDNNKAYQKQYRLDHAEKNRLYRKEYYELNKEKIIITRKEYYSKNKERIMKNNAIYIRNRRKNNIEIRIKHNLQRRIHHALFNAVKSDFSINLLGCSIEYCKNHLEKQFLLGMTWENYGKNGWHIDHIRPCDSFDLTDPNQQKICFHYTNLQPLWAADNIRKKNKYPL